MTPFQRDLKSRQLKAPKMRMKKRIEKEKIITIRYRQKIYVGNYYR